jgi:DNA (cytosine-5)-methyltransferase 1
LRQYKQCHFFAGIGGWSIALRLAGVSDDEPIWTGSCPCQPLSVAGRRQGHADERHLWPAFYRLISERKPATVFGEQVASKDGRGWFAGVRADLENTGYACGCADLCAASVGSPQKRQRLYWMAFARSRFGRGGTIFRPGESAAARSKGTPDEPSKRGVDSISELAVSTSEQKQSVATKGFYTKPGASGDMVDQLADLQSGQYRGIPGEKGDTGKEIRVRSGTDIEHGCTVGVAQGDTNCAGLSQQCGSIAISPEQPAVELRSAANRMAHTGHDAGCAEQGDKLQKHISGDRQPGAWDNSRIIQTSDGKSRRIPIEPAFYPLVDGFPARVDFLKGFGNAIVPQVAARFIAAAHEAIREMNK